nr:hypothetical protein GCM10020093_062900 [Planobispora longispora]
MGGAAAAHPVPARVTGADLIWSLSEAAAFYGYPIYVLGGPPGVARRRRPGSSATTRR